jgi:hypothetical protein
LKKQIIKITLIVLAILYVLNPYDIFPDMVVGWGWLDDLIVLGLLWRFLYTQKRNLFFFRNNFQQRQQYDQNSSGRNYFRDNESNSYSQFRENDAPWDPYMVLGINRSATPEEIKTAYRQLANRYHPDKVAHLGEEFRQLAEKRFKEIQRAYQELKTN